MLPVLVAQNVNGYGEMVGNCAWFDILTFLQAIQAFYSYGKSYSVLPALVDFLISLYEGLLFLLTIVFSRNFFFSKESKNGDLVYQC